MPRLSLILHFPELQHSQPIVKEYKRYGIKTATLYMAAIFNMNTLILTPRQLKRCL